ncbi:uncharacterized protein LOC114074281 [Solanum pennellii]|uniref:Uncharacterized protein LOC114074281 n=1 Tax=Solanum pennellii TaxID=28526 RepID=A0ABM1UWS2_SOLPN|nr:uncharacterized protein LOC114074281 [Solanum pennellii]
MFSDNGNPLKFKNIEPSLKEIAFYQLESKSDAITENTIQDVGSRLKDKRPTVLNGCRKAKSTTLDSYSNPLEDNVSVQDLHNCPDDSANRTPPRSSKEPQDTKADEIGLLRQDLASFKNYVNNEFKELRLFIMGNFRQVMNALNRSSRESGAPRQEDATESPSHVPNWSNNNPMKNGNQISNVMDKPHCDANEVRTPRFVLQEHVKVNVKEYLQPVQIHIQDPLTVHEQLNDINVFQNHDIQQPQSQIELIDALLPDIDAINPKKNDVVHSEVVVHPEGVVYDTTPVPVQRIRHPDRLTGDGNVIQNDGIQQPQSQFELLNALLPDIDIIYPKKNVVVHSEVVVRPEGGVYDNTRVPVQSIIHSDRLICSPYSTNIGSSFGRSYDVVKTYEKKHHFVSDFIQGPYNYDLF